MGYHWSFARAMNDLFDISAEKEELNADFKNNEFVATTGKLLSVLLSIVAPISVTVGLLIVFLIRESADIGILFIGIGCCGVLLIPTLFSYRCTVNKNFMLEEYFILCFKRKKKIFWSDVKYQKTVFGNNSRIVFYNQSKKRLISFDGGIVGFKAILKMAKRKGIPALKKQ